jgi:hypothetical protein
MRIKADEIRQAMEAALSKSDEQHIQLMQSSPIRMPFTLASFDIGIHMR